MHANWKISNITFVTSYKPAYYENVLWFKLIPSSFFKTQGLELGQGIKMAKIINVWIGYHNGAEPEYHLKNNPSVGDFLPLASHWFIYSIASRCLLQGTEKPEQ